MSEENKRIYLASPHMGGLEEVFVKEAFDTNWIAPLGANVDGFEKELSEYGLDEDLRAAVEVTYQEDEKEKKLTLYIGNRVGDDRYVMLNDSKIVYLVSDAICGNILNEEE